MIRSLAFVSALLLTISLAFAEDAKPAKPAEKAEAKPAAPKKVDVGMQAPDFKIKDANGKEILSHKAPGNVADFDEALEILVGGYAHKDRILKSDATPGSGNRGNGGGGGNSKQITRAQHTAMTPAESGAHFASGGTIVD